MENSHRQLTSVDRLYLQRAYELAARGIGNASPNPPVGAVIARDARLIGEGYHYRAGEAHAESLALAQAGSEARGATAYVSLEPCGHVGRTPPCTHALIEAGVARVVAGTLDPSNHGGAADLREHGIEVTVADDPTARDLIEIFAHTSLSKRPYVALKMAMSLDGAVATRVGLRERLGSEAEERYVRELRTAYDAVMVGAGTVRVDDPRLTVRPPHHRARPYARVVACQSDTIPIDARVFTAQEEYAKTIVLAPAGRRTAFDELRNVADLMYIGDATSVTLDLSKAMQALRTGGLFSVLCEGGPTLGGALLAAGTIDRIYWAIAPRLINGRAAVPVLSGSANARVNLRFDRVERIGVDVLISGTVCSAGS